MCMSEKNLSKEEIRRQALLRRDRMSEEERRIGALRLTDRILGHQWYYMANRILIFASFGTEIDTTELIKEALRNGKEVFLPRVEGDEMQFYRIFSTGDLYPGYRGILEPDGTTQCYFYEPEACDHVLMIMPGAAFDLYRNRIGYGKGFYDRYLADKPKLQLHTIGIGFKCQMVEEILSEEQDVKPYQVILI